MRVNFVFEVFEVAGKTFNQIRDGNIRTAKALGITVPPSVLARANEVIE